MTTTTETAQLREALAPFARVGDLTLLVHRRDENGEHWFSTGSYAALNIGDFRHARDVYQALAAHPEGGGGSLRDAAYWARLAYRADYDGQGKLTQPNWPNPDTYHMTGAMAASYNRIGAAVAKALAAPPVAGEREAATGGDLHLLADAKTKDGWVSIRQETLRELLAPAGGLMAHRCSICGGSTFVQADIRQFDGTYAPGPERQCVGCKATFTAQTFAALTDPQAAAKEPSA